MYMCTKILFEQYSKGDFTLDITMYVIVFHKEEDDQDAKHIDV